MGDIKDFVNGKVTVEIKNKDEFEAFGRLLNGYPVKWRTGDKFLDFMPTAVDSINGIFVHCKNGDITYTSCKEYFDNIVSVNEFFSKYIPYEIIIECDGNDITTAKMIINGKVVKESKAKRNPEDKFDFKIASKLAFDRLFSRKKRKEVERPAKAGETIKVVNADDADGVYKNGDVFKVEKHEFGMVKVKANNPDKNYIMWDNEPNTATICDEEYVVLE